MALLDGGRGFALGFVTGVGAGYFSRELMDNPRARARPVAKFVMRTMRRRARGGKVVHLPRRHREAA
jgi:hypothetical protein